MNRRSLLTLAALAPVLPHTPAPMVISGNRIVALAKRSAVLTVQLPPGHFRWEGNTVLPANVVIQGHSA